MIKSLVCLIILFFNRTYKQENIKIQTSNTHFQKYDSADFTKRAVAFINQVMKISHLDTNFILSDKPVDIDYHFHCLKGLLTDTITFTKEELNYLQHKQYPQISSWKDHYFPKLKLVSNDTLIKIFNDDNKGWDYFDKNIGEEYHNFSVPVFLRNYTYCLFYEDVHCSGLCGDGRLVLYKWSHNRWKEVKVCCSWIT